MATFLDRYRRGECEQVWSELLALGDQVRKQPLYTDALAVASETMTRARKNIELLAPRLTKLGYRFAHPERMFVPTNKEFRELVAQVESRGGLLPLSLRAWCEVVGEVNFMGSHPKLSIYVESRLGQDLGQNFLSLFAKHGGAAPAAGDSLRQSFELTQQLLSEVVQRIKTGQPRTLNQAAGVRASKEFLQQLQQPTAMEGPDVESDPLVVEPYFLDLEEDMEGEDEAEAEAGPGPHDVIIAPDSTHKTNHSGGSPYVIQFPDLAIDSPMQGEEDYGTFVEYLRMCFRWGGFPGLRASTNPPREELAFLTEGLLPL
jgi:hypothetical protein